MIRAISTICTVVATLSLLAAPASGRSSLLPSTPAATVAAEARGLIVQPGQLHASRTLQARSMRELADLAAPISEKAYLKYGGDWRAYWRASNFRNQRSGKVLEAALAWRVNEHRARTGNPNRLLVTEAEPRWRKVADLAERRRRVATDLVDVAPDGTIVGRYQAKWGRSATMRALRDPRYEGMTILTTRDTFESLERGLLKAEAKAARRGVSLPSRWQAVRDAFNTERLPSTIGGKSLPTAKGVQQLAKGQVRIHFLKSAGMNESVAAEGGRLFKPSIRIAGKLLIVVDVAGTAYMQYEDVQRFRSGAIGGGYLAFRSTLRGAQLSLAIYAVATPEPFSKLASGIAAGALIVVDVVSDPIHQAVFARRQAAALALLETVDREERFHAARSQLLSAGFQATSAD